MQCATVTLLAVLVGMCYPPGMGNMPPILHVSDLNRQILEDLREAAASYRQVAGYTSAFDVLQTDQDCCRTLASIRACKVEGLQAARFLRDRLLAKWSSARSLSKQRMPALGRALAKALEPLRTIPCSTQIWEAAPVTIERMVGAFQILDDCAGVGGTVASKMLSALRPQLFLMWDMPIARAYGFDTNAAGYRRFLQLMTPAAQKIRELWGSGNGDLEDYLKPEGRAWRPTLAKALDEWHWVRITRGIAFGSTAKA